MEEYRKKTKVWEQVLPAFGHSLAVECLNSQQAPHQVKKSVTAQLYDS